MRFVKAVAYSIALAAIAAAIMSYIDRVRKKDAYIEACMLGFDEAANIQAVYDVLIDKKHPVDKATIKLKKISNSDRGAFYEFSSGNISGRAFGDLCGIYDLNALDYGPESLPRQ